MLVTESYEYDCKSSKHSNKLGKLVISELKLEWLLPGNIQSEITIEFSQIKDLMASAKTPKLKVNLLPSQNETESIHYIFEFKDLATKDKCRNLIAKFLGEFKKQKQEKSAPEIEKKIKLLSEKPELKKLFDDLVRGNILSEEDFWNNHKHESELTESEEVGLKNSYFCISNVMESTSSTEVKLRFTAQIIKQIFAEFPAVQASYRANVPHKISEKEFWQRFAKSHYLHRKRSQGLLEPGEEDIFGKYEREVEEKFSSKTNTTVEKFVDLTMVDEREHYGTRSDELTAPSRTGASLPILKDYNIRSTSIMQSMFGEKQEENETEDRKHTIMEELLVSNEQPYIPLNIHNKSRYFEGLQTKDDVSSQGSMIAASRNELVSDYAPSELLREFEQEVLVYVVNLQSAAENIATATKITAELSHQATLTIGDNTFLTPQSGSISEEFKETLKEHFNIITELLRHMWLILSQQTSKWTNKTKEKAEKLIIAMREKYKMIQALEREQVERSTTHHDHYQVNQTKQLTKPLLDSLEYAIDQYEQRIKMKQEAPVRSSSTTTTTAVTQPSTPQARADGQPTSAPSTPGFGGMTLGRISPSTPSVSTPSVQTQQQQQQEQQKVSFPLLKKTTTSSTSNVAPVANGGGTSPPGPPTSFSMSISKKPTLSQQLRTSTALDPNEHEPANKKLKK
jgi:hypothetical protein